MIQGPVETLLWQAFRKAQRAPMCGSCVLLDFRIYLADYKVMVYYGPSTTSLAPLKWIPIPLVLVS